MLRVQMKIALLLVISITVLGACTGRVKLPEPEMTTREVIDVELGGRKERPVVHGRYVAGQPDYTGYTRDASNELDVVFAFLPNPTLLMYVYPHLTSQGAPIPGYSTRFRMYVVDQYALPGEVDQ